MPVKEKSAGEIAEKVHRGEPLFILDVRNEQAFQDWKIEGAGIRYLNVPYFELLDGVDSIASALPTDEEVLVVCAKEGSSVMVAEMLAEQGFEVSYLKGGMSAWSELLIPRRIGELHGGGELYQFVRVGKGCLSYMAISDGEAVIIDAARMADDYIGFAAGRYTKIKHVLDTHLHADHISGGRRIAERTNASYWLPPKDAAEVTFKYNPLEDGSTITCGRIAIEVVASPGHTGGSTSFVIDGRYLLTGDSLFIDSIGRPDLAGLAGEWAGDLRETLYGRYAVLSGDLTVLPAHYMTPEEMNADGTFARTLSELYKQNHGLQINDSETFRQLVTRDLPPQPNAYQEIRQTNRGKLKPGENEQREMEIGPNRCAVR